MEFHSTFYGYFFLSNVVSEAMRMRHICEDKTDYDTSLEYLKNKCFKSKFSRNQKIIEQAKFWVDKFHPVNNNKSKENKQQKIVWAAQFPKLLQSSQMEN